MGPPSENTNHKTLVIHNRIMHNRHAARPYVFRVATITNRVVTITNRTSRALE